jgi:prepilin-type N-terminal cleavage/methylation domain-containing protein
MNIQINKNGQSGFTLIELVMVIVILGILAASALPKFVNLEGEAQQAAVEGVAGALASASAINYASRSVSASAGNAVANCTDVATSLAGGLTDGTITAGAIVADATATCTLTLDGKTKTFIGHGI